MTDTTNEAIAALCERLRDGPWLHPNRLTTEAAATIEKLQAERDAALARYETLADSYSKPFDKIKAEGARQATAAIVDHMLRAACDPVVVAFLRGWRDGETRGDHLKAPGAGGAGE